VNPTIQYRTHLIVAIITSTLLGASCRTVESSRAVSLKKFVTSADAIVVAQVLAVDRRRTARDGPAVVEAKALKVLRGPFSESQIFTFERGVHPAGPPYCTLEPGIFFLKQRGEDKPWRLDLMAAREASLQMTSFCVEKEVLEDVSIDLIDRSLQSLKAYSRVMRVRFARDGVWAEYRLHSAPSAVLLEKLR
jgi:hypothetical protein